MKLMMDAGLPAGVINFIPGRASVVGDICMSHPDLAGVHFTGSTAVFRKLWRDIANNLESETCSQLNLKPTRARAQVALLNA